MPTHWALGCNRSRDFLSSGNSGCVDVLPQPTRIRILRIMPVHAPWIPPAAGPQSNAVAAAEANSLHAAGRRCLRLCRFAGLSELERLLYETSETLWRKTSVDAAAVSPPPARPTHGRGDTAACPAISHLGSRTISEISYVIFMPRRHGAPRGMKIVISWSGTRVLANAGEAILVRQTRV